MSLRWKIILLVCLVTLPMMMGCASRKPLEPDPEPVLEEEEESGLRLIAVLPVDNRSGDELASEIVRNEIRQQLYFKGYPAIPIVFIDEKLSELVGGGAPEDALSLPPQKVGAALGVDALLYTTLTKWGTSKRFLFASTDVSVSFVLKCAKTGEILWEESSREKDRHMAITGNRAKEKAKIHCDEALRVVMNEVMETFPDGPGAVGSGGKQEELTWYHWYQRFLRWW